MANFVNSKQQFRVAALYPKGIMLGLFDAQCSIICYTNMYGRSQRDAGRSWPMEKKNRYGITPAYCHPDDKSSNLVENQDLKKKW